MSKKKERTDSKAETVAEEEIAPEAAGEEVEGADEGEAALPDQAVEEVEQAEGCFLAKNLARELAGNFVDGKYSDYSAKGIEQQVLPKLEQIIRHLS